MPNAWQQVWISQTYRSVKTDASCRSECDTLKHPNYSMHIVKSAEQRSKFAVFHRRGWCLHIKWKFLEKSTNKHNKIISLSVFVLMYCSKTHWIGLFQELRDSLSNPRQSLNIASFLWYKSVTLKCICVLSFETIQQCWICYVNCSEF